METVSDLARQLADALLARRQLLAVAESCTGGLLAKVLTDLAGSSGWFERGVVVYSNLAKQQLLAVPALTISTSGAVSEETARAMARGLLATTPAHWAIAITGVAGPGGGSAEKPVGTVWIAWGGRDASISARCFQFDGDRAQVREAAVVEALRGLLALL